MYWIWKHLCQLHVMGICLFHRYFKTIYLKHKDSINSYLSYVLLLGRIAQFSWIPVSWNSRNCCCVITERKCHLYLPPWIKEICLSPWNTVEKNSVESSKFLLAIFHSFWIVLKKGQIIYRSPFLWVETHKKKKG